MSFTTRDVDVLASAIRSEAWHFDRDTVTILFFFTKHNPAPRDERWTEVALLMQQSLPVTIGYRLCYTDLD